MRPGIQLDLKYSIIFSSRKYVFYQSVILIINKQFSTVAQKVLYTFLLELKKNLLTYCHWITNYQNRHCKYNSHTKVLKLI